ncbi:WXG100 family type VII secretion target [Streptomyces albireticuli]|uniref:Collagen alpha 1(II) chain n=1 Tax=Streptomyces albireticuli TaxID=1940 RepID=A0A2A2D5L1_9ACTN|nr:hypothetical protein [Streptomyces albireticuli]MCD9141492.1 hypothetical protein [Streptomyces albireticuli]MCD9164257.1 hypothetical protein [Streptomyces albireticuli]MCD9189666.1 hypothetical protein [Streptomyces albireticuli]PAU46815.1 hypothetical protein CK936_22095 [Streptomyces albireticuli]
MADRAPAPKSAKDPRHAQAYTEQDFFTIPHEKLQAMVEHADCKRVEEIAKRLGSASKAIKDLGDDLKEHVDGVVWAGPAGDAFRKWGVSMSNEAGRLGEYAETAGTWMTHAAADLLKATKMPKYSAADKALVDSWVKAHPYVFGGVPNPLINLVDKGLKLGGPDQKAAYDAQKRLSEAHHDAAGRMKALAESYQHTGTQIMMVKRPNFPPMPDAVMPSRRDQYDSEDVDLPGGGGGGYSGGGPSGAGPSGYGPGGSAGGGPGLPGSPGYDERPRSRPDLDLSGGVDTTPRTRVPLPDRPPVTPPDTGRPHIPGPLPPVPNWPGPDRRPGPGPRPDGRLPDQGRRPAPRTPGPGLPGPGPVPRPDTRLPQPAPGPTPRPGGRLPNPPHDGIIGGQPAPRGGTSGPTQNPGRSNVFGAEPTQRQGQTRPPMSGPVGAGGGFPGVSGPPASRPGTGAGRHMATDPGGIVGGRPGQRPGGGGTPFTPGGTGLVRGPGEGTGTTTARNGMPAGMMPGAGLGGATPERRGGGGRRPDYLVEDEETWAQSKPVVPPVIE